MKRKRVLIIGVIIVALAAAGAAYWGGHALKGSGSTGSEVSTVASPISGNSSQQVLSNTPGDIRGTVKSVQGNQVLIARIVNDPSANLTEAERAAQQQKMQNASQAERDAFRQQQLQGTQTVNAHVTIPVGVPIVKVAAGQGAGGTGENASLADIKPGITLVIWTQDHKTDNASALSVAISPGP